MAVSAKCRKKKDGPCRKCPKIATALCLLNLVSQIAVDVKRQVKPDYLTLLQHAIEEKHQCRAVHRESVHVHETMGDKTIWAGDVEVFELIGHADAAKCYGWSHREPGTNGHVLNSETMRLITVLGKRPVDSPQMAVRAAIFYDVQPTKINPGRE